MIDTQQLIVIGAIFVFVIGGIMVMGGKDTGTKQENRQTDKEKITIAFTLIFLGILMQQLPEEIGSSRVIAFLAGMLVLIGLIKSIHLLRDSGLWGSILFIASSIALMIASWMEGSIPEFLNVLKSMPSNSIMDGLGSNMETNTFSTSPASGFSWGAAGHLLAILAAGCWLTYKPFRKMLTGLVLLIVIHLVYIIDPSFLKGFIHSVLGILTVAGYYHIVVNVAPSDDSNRPLKALLLMAVGMIWFSLIMVETKGTIIGISAIGTIIWFTGVSRIRHLGDRRGTGAFIAFGILSFVLLLFLTLTRLISKVILLDAGMFGFIFRIPAYIVLAIAFFRFHSNRIFQRQKTNGMVLMGIAMLLAMLTILTNFFYYFIVLPMMLISWINAVKSSIKNLETNGLLMGKNTGVNSIGQIAVTESVVQEKADINEMQVETGQQTTYNSKLLFHEKINSNQLHPAVKAPVDDQRLFSKIVTWLFIILFLLACGAAGYYNFYSP